MPSPERWQPRISRPLSKELEEPLKKDIKDKHPTA